MPNDVPKTNMVHVFRTNNLRKINNVKSLACGDAGMALIRVRRKACISALFVGIMFLVLLRERFGTDSVLRSSSERFWGSNVNFVGSSTVWKRVELSNSGEVP